MTRTPRSLLAALALRLAVAAAAALCACDALAGHMPFGGARVEITAREQPIGAFLQDLFGQIDVPVVVSPGVKGAVNGSFDTDAAAVLRKLSRAFGLVLYYDGAVMHVYSVGEMITHTVPTPSAEVARRVERTAREMRLVDERNRLRVTRDGVLVATGTRRFIEQVAELNRASQMRQSANPPLGFKVFYLRYAWAHDVTVNLAGRRVLLPGVASILRSLVTSGSSGSTRVLPNEQPLRPTQEKLRGQGLARDPVLGAGEAGRSRADNAVEAAYGGTAGVPDPNVGRPIELGRAGQVRIEADKRLNAVIVRDAPERLPMYEELVRSLDMEPQSLEIEATIIDVNTDRATELGINWRANAGRSSLLFGSGGASDQLLQPGGGVVGSAITPVGRGGFVSAVLGDASQFVARINALQSEGAARVVSSPQVVTLSNVEAVFDNSSTFYVRVAGKDEVDLFNVSAGTSLRVTPHVFTDGEGVRIKLLVNLEDGSVSRVRQVDGIPVVDRSSINTQALIYEGESLLIGGLTRESSETSVDKVPGLGDIPVVGNLFKSRVEGGGRVERLFLISPRLSPRRTARAGGTGGRPGAAALPAAPPQPAASGVSPQPEPAPTLAPTSPPVPSAPVSQAPVALAALEPAPRGSDLSARMAISSPATGGLLSCAEIARRAPGSALSRASRAQCDDLAWPGGRTPL